MYETNPAHSQQQTKDNCHAPAFILCPRFISIIISILSDLSKRLQIPPRQSHEEGENALGRQKKVDCPSRA